MSHITYSWNKVNSGVNQAAICSVPDEVHVLRKGILGVQVTTSYTWMFSFQSSSFTME